MISLSLWTSKLCSFVYITQCCQYTTELIFPLFSVLTDSFQVGRKTAPRSQPVFKDQWLYPRIHTSSPLINVLFTNSFTACQPESKTQGKKACFYLQKSFQFLWERCYMHINSAFYDLSENLPWNTVTINSKWDANSIHITVRMSQDWGFYYICSFPRITLPENVCSLLWRVCALQECSVNN